MVSRLRARGAVRHQDLPVIYQEGRVVYLANCNVPFTKFTPVILHLEMEPEERPEILMK